MVNATISENGLGFPVNPVEKNAPQLTLSDSGAPIVISELGAPFIVSGYVPPIEIVGWNDDASWDDGKDWDDDGTI